MWDDFRAKVPDLNVSRTSTGLIGCNSAQRCAGNNKKKALRFSLKPPLGA